MPEKHIPWLNPDNLEFPDVNTAWDDPNGILAAGGDLTTERLINAYSHGIFPWYNENEPILWWSPDPRCVLLPAELKVSKS
ncbi:MAG: leucyl/phenylalanyl-tRNA--protein transferase, partial [Gammaproteobacteria bacterium]|nr:leucyl/phenylalanyl-tRNA--protein transferase [Gammaproteobacteria bacterium]